MRLIMLVQSEHRPIPESIRAQEFGTESIKTEGGDFIIGASAFLEGPEEAFVEWLRPFDGVWVTDNPAMGRWAVVHIKNELKEQLNVG